ncbi:uncharacterized protein LOC142351676 [Convolutriloba macropyga]|uniref:uncharacterized protein LOC142351676 n=1 Tax=Convolutriloba macropyga TaxID=536237 RepID=UPI003F527E4E
MKLSSVGSGDSASSVEKNVPTMSQIKSVVQDLAQKISDEGISTGVKSLNDINKTITQGLSEDVRKELTKMETGVQGMLKRQEQLQNKIEEGSQILDGKIRAVGFVEEAEESLREARMRRMVEERVAQAESAIRDTLSKQYLNDLMREIGAARDECERQNTAKLQKTLEQANQQHQQQLRVMREQLIKDFEAKEIQMEKETQRQLEIKNQQIKTLLEDMNMLKEKHFKENQHKDMMFAEVSENE